MTQSSRKKKVKVVYTADNVSDDRSEYSPFSLFSLKRKLALILRLARPTHGKRNRIKSHLSLVTISEHAKK